MPKLEKKWLFLCHFFLRMAVNDFKRTSYSCLVTFDFSSKNQDFLTKKSKFGPKMAFLFILGQALLAHLVGGCGARTVSRKTPIYFIYNYNQTKSQIVTMNTCFANCCSRQLVCKSLLRIICFKLSKLSFGNSFCNWPFRIFF